ncbi:FAD-dependent monooxygenase [Streptomyces poonensis]|uniref:FAD-dependent oxidoreductase n=1 Tax=Streptomyces poonensis TaxID=68255 RepID=A0A918PIF0_9ACTN|nr:FAD-dependent monooxygenase [Streptomyces poonensis]GGZ10917.1 FAD-dependent oxidoreductase [Streptomyces poonensis]GLJ91654.1 FAD-dependent oxidoreductase [Streptomyces poonensis]
MADETTEVLIVGGSMVGLAQALFLARQGIRPLLVERHAEISAHPRAQAASPRTMELLRALGLEDAVRARENPHAQYGDILQAESLTGAELGRFDGPFRHDPNDVGTTGWTLIGQDRLEPVLRERAEELGADIRFATEMTEFTQDADGVTAVLRDLGDGSERTVRARYLVAADGSRAPVRTSLGIGRHGPGVFGRQMNIVFHADLDPYVAGRTFFLCFVSNPTVKGVLGKLGGADSDRWVLAPSLPPGADHRAYGTEDCVELVRAAVGVPDLPVAVESATSWEIAAWVADRFRSGRVLLAGDCAHVMPPTGGFGGNMGIQDAHNLAWKLARVLRGEAGPGLLDTYEQERAPVAEFTVDQGVIRYLQRSGLDEAAAARHRPETTVLFGHVYRSDAVIGEAGDDGTGVVEDPTTPSGRPGTRAPHLPLVRQGKEIPLHDLLDGDFWLLAGPNGTAWQEPAATLGLSFHRVGTEEPPEVVERFLARYGVQDTGAVLLRPDGFIAWRGTDLPEHPAESLMTTLDTVLHRTAPQGLS